MNDGRIVGWAPYGQHIALTCKNHPNLRWSTKNIEYIGARSIFYNSWELSEECSCSAVDLIPAVPEGAVEVPA